MKAKPPNLALGKSVIRLVKPVNCLNDLLRSIIMAISLEDRAYYTQLRQAIADISQSLAYNIQRSVIAETAAQSNLHPGFNVGAFSSAFTYNVAENHNAGPDFFYALLGAVEMVLRKSQRRHSDAVETTLHYKHQIEMDYAAGRDIDEIDSDMYRQLCVQQNQANQFHKTAAGLLAPLGWLIRRKVDVDFDIERANLKLKKLFRKTMDYLRHEPILHAVIASHIAGMTQPDHGLHKMAIIQLDIALDQVRERFGYSHVAETMIAITLDIDNLRRQNYRVDPVIRALCRHYKKIAQPYTGSDWPYIMDFDTFLACGLCDGNALSQSVLTNYAHQYNRIKNDPAKARRIADALHQWLNYFETADEENSWTNPTFRQLITAQAEAFFTTPETPLNAKIAVAQKPLGQG